MSAKNVGSTHVAFDTALYGSLGAIITFMVWPWLSALAVLIGAEVITRKDMPMMYG